MLIYDHWVVGSNPIRGMFIINFKSLSPILQLCAKERPETKSFNLISVLFRKSYQTIIWPNCSGVGDHVTTPV